MRWLQERWPCYKKRRRHASLTGGESDRRRRSWWRPRGSSPTRSSSASAPWNSTPPRSSWPPCIRWVSWILHGIHPVYLYQWVVLVAWWEGGLFVAKPGGGHRGMALRTLDCGAEGPLDPQTGKLSFCPPSSGWYLVPLIYGRSILSHSLHLFIIFLPGANYS